MKAILGEVLTGPAGTATEVLVTEHDRPDTDATIASWFLRCPGQSPGWDCYLACAIHLRPIPDVHPAEIRLEGATHEFMVVALNPQTTPVPEDPYTWAHLIPVNVCEQFIVDTDDQARHLTTLCVQAIVEGLVWAEPPLSGQRVPWTDIITATAAHERGEHG